MSVFIVSERHISALITAGLDKTYPAIEMVPTYTLANADEVGRDLLAENIKSVQYRYRDVGHRELPGPIPTPVPACYRFVPVTPPLSPVAALKQLNCYVYQSSEHPGWENSAACTFCEWLRDQITQQLPGYDEAPWGL